MDDTMHEEWTEKLSEYLDGELPAADRRAVERHLSACAHCAGIFAGLSSVVARARSIDPRPPKEDLWPGIAERIGDRPAETMLTRPPLAFRMVSRQVSVSVLQLAAAAVLLMAVSGGLTWSIAGRTAAHRRADPSADLQVRGASGADLPPSREASADRHGPGGDGQVRDSSGTEGQVHHDEYDVQTANLSFADQQYDAAVADLERALNRGRGRLDASTIAIVEHNLQIIDQAIAQARQALAADPANSYLSSHLVEARRRKLDLLRRAAALTGETD
jgi:hypothetical protein